MNVYCVFCKSGTEDSVSEQIATLMPQIEVLIPVRTIQEKKQGNWTERKQQLIPGYIFLYIEDEVTFQNIKMLSNVFNVLKYSDNTRELKGADYQYAMWLYRYFGNISTSTIITEGSNIKVIDGPLKDGIGKIIKLDRHKRRAWVEIEFLGTKRIVSLSIEDITSRTA